MINRHTHRRTVTLRRQSPRYAEGCAGKHLMMPTEEQRGLERPKLAQSVAHVTRDSDTTFKVKRSRSPGRRPLYSPPCLRVRQLQRWVWERVGREKLLLRVAVCLALRRSRERRGGGISWRPPAYSLFILTAPWGESSVGRNAHGAKRL